MIGGVRRQVVGAEDAAAVEDVGGDEAGEVAGVQGGGALVGDQLERVGQVGDDDQVGDELALVVVDGGAAGVVPAEDRVVDVLQVVARRRAQPEAAAGHVDRRRDHLAPRQPAVAAVRLLERRHRAVRRDRAGSDGDVHAAAVLGVDVPRAAAERATAAAGHVHPAVDGVRRAAARRLDRDEPARAQRDQADLVDHRDQRGGERRVDRVAAGPGDLLAGVGGRLVGGGDRDVGHARPYGRRRLREVDGFRVARECGGRSERGSRFGAAGGRRRLLATTGQLAGAGGLDGSSLLRHACRWARRSLSRW